VRASALVIALAAGCGSRGAPSSHVIVNAFGGDRAEPGALVIAHSPDGQLIDEAAADAVGRAEVGVDADSLVSVVFPGTITNITPVISVITTMPPADGSELSIHGPNHSSAPPLIVGVLTVDAPNLNTATYFDVRLGCTTVRVTKLPATVDVSGCNMGSDQNLDVLVRGYHDLGGDPPAPQLDGYGAGRVPMVNGVASFTVPSWETGGTAVAVTLDGVTPYLDWVMHVDGLDFISEPVATQPHLYTGLVVDATSITATVPAENGARITTREVTGAPASLAFATADFLPTLTSRPTIVSTSPATISWAATDIAADALNLHATWDVTAAVSPAGRSESGQHSGDVVPPGPHRVVWDAVLPPSAAGVTLPVLGDDIGAAIEPAQGIVAIDVLLRAIDGSAQEGFAGVLAAGIRAEETIQASTIVPRPVDGEVRVAHTIGGP